MMNTDTENWLVRRAIQSAPQEACGFIMQTGEIVEIRNVSQNPCRAFEMDVYQIGEKLSHRTDLISGIWHTHPGGTRYPSRKDLESIKCGAIHSNWDYYIVTAQGVWLYIPGNYAPQPEQFWERFTA